MPIDSRALHARILRKPIRKDTRPKCRECDKPCDPYDDLEISIRWKDVATEIVADGCCDDCLRKAVYRVFFWTLPEDEYASLTPGNRARFDGEY